MEWVLEEGDIRVQYSSLRVSFREVCYELGDGSFGLLRAPSWRQVSVPWTVLFTILLDDSSCAYADTVFNVSV